ncbi:DUF4097 family beta strand repeat-containing protein [Edaphobacillus lindanitolerans]|uniref:DUF4097 domain-containing protein n=1 Tax=Edaphobacillus lindanitolerans TaxID=550447 RepID=A0A1U7PQR1_9BACI|nr:DUF4097 family beta strand repeat-containing protein [Edaphobacillus lindanitolerans]SIT84746.1 Protein of unknown function [Edaphobacillus lindanitolerans]
MGKNEFLNELRQHLTVLPEEERNDILQDLNEYFDEGKREGKSESDISSSLGTPSEIAADILSAYPEYTRAQDSRALPQDARYELVQIPQGTYSNVMADIAVGELKLTPSEDETTRFELIGDKSEVKFNADIRQDMLVISLKGEKTITSWFRRAVSRPFRLVVHLPKRLYSLVRAETSNGSLSAEKILARSFTAESANGRILVRECAFGTLSARTDNGRVEMQKVEAGTLSAFTDNGRIELRAIRSDRVSAETDNGRIIFSDVEGDIDAKTDNGRIELTTDSIDRNIQLLTDNGSITVTTDRLPEDAVVRVRSDSGRPDIFGSADRERVFGRGTHTVRLETDNGKITLRNS